MKVIRRIKRIIRGNVRTDVLENADPKKWREHLFGLTPERWNSLSGKAFWITGAGTGYGRSISCALAAAGAKVFFTGRRKAKIQESIEEIKSFGISAENCFIVDADITDPEQVRSACGRVMSHCGSLSGLVNNAALSEKLSKPFQEGSLGYWNRMMATNVTAPFFLTKAAFPHMMKSGHVRVLFISSGAGWASTPGFGIYNVSKAALNSLAQSMAKEYADHYPDADIQMNVVSPGEARTEMNQGSDISPYSIASIALLLLSHPKNGPNGKFFARDGAHLEFCHTKPYGRPLS